MNDSIEHRGFTIVVDDGGLKIRNPYGVTVCYMGGTAKGIPLAKTIIDRMIDEPRRKTKTITEKQRRAFTRRFNKLAGF